MAEIHVSWLFARSVCLCGRWNAIWKVNPCMLHMSFSMPPAISRRQLQSINANELVCWAMPQLAVRHISFNFLGAVAGFSSAHDLIHALRLESHMEIILQARALHIRYDVVVGKVWYTTLQAGVPLQTAKGPTR